MKEFDLEINDEPIQKPEIFLAELKAATRISWGLPACSDLTWTPNGSGRPDYGPPDTWLRWNFEKRLVELRVNGNWKEIELDEAVVRHTRFLESVLIYRQKDLIFFLDTVRERSRSTDISKRWVTVIDRKLVDSPISYVTLASGVEGWDEKIRGLVISRHKNYFDLFPIDIRWAFFYYQLFESEHQYFF